VPLTFSHPTQFSRKKFTGHYYLSGAVPLPWLVEADRAGGSALKVGLLLWHLKGIKKTPENLAVTRKVAWDRLKIGRSALARGFDRLEDSGLITTTRGQGKAIRVTLLPINPPEAHISTIFGVNTENAEVFNV